MSVAPLRDASGEEAQATASFGVIAALKRNGLKAVKATTVDVEPKTILIDGMSPSGHNFRDYSSSPY